MNFYEISFNKWLYKILYEMTKTVRSFVSDLHGSRKFCQKGSKFDKVEGV